MSAGLELWCLTPLNIGSKANSEMSAQMSEHLDSAIRQVTKQMNVRKIWMGAVKEKDSRQTHNDNKSDCTDGEAEYETESSNILRTSEAKTNAATRRRQS